MTKKGKYPENWKEISDKVKEEAEWNCERCGHGHWPEGGYTLTTHHLDNDKSNIERWNLAALCQRCHLRIQGKVFLPQFYMFEHSSWFMPHVKGFYESIGIYYEFLPSRNSSSRQVRLTGALND